MPNYASKDELVQGRQLKVQRLSIPFVITANASSASVLISRDEPAVLFLKTQGNDEITAALVAGDGTPSYTAANDANGIFNILVKLNEQVGKVMNARVVGRNTAKDYICTLADTDGISGAGDKICLDCDADISLATTSLDACLVVEYVIAE